MRVLEKANLRLSIEYVTITSQADFMFGLELNKSIYSRL